MSWVDRDAAECFICCRPLAECGTAIRISIGDYFAYACRACCDRLDRVREGARR